MNLFCNSVLDFVQIRLAVKNKYTGHCNTETLSLFNPVVITVSRMYIMLMSGFIYVVGKFKVAQ